MNVITEGDPTAPAYVFLHGWPQTSHCWRGVMRLAADAGCFAVAVDLPGIGASAAGAPTPTVDDTKPTPPSDGAKPSSPPDGAKPTPPSDGARPTPPSDGARPTSTADGTKAALATVVRDALQPLGLRDVTLVGHDAGGMIAFAYLRAYGAELRRAVIMNTVVPGIAPWEEVLRNPYIWHFGFHAVPELPERLVRGHERQYFDYFFDILSPDPSAVPDEARDIYAAAYAVPGALEAGFSWYRAFPADAAANKAAVAAANKAAVAAADGAANTAADEAASTAADAQTTSLGTPLLYLRGEFEPVDIEVYAAGFRAAGITNLRTGVIAGAGHFAPDQAPAAVWDQISG